MPDTPDSTDSSKTGKGAAPSKTGKKAIQLNRHKKQYRGRSGVCDGDIIVEFLFTMRDLDAGDRPVGDPQNFWCEIQLKSSLASRPGWAALGDDDRVKAMYSYAIDFFRKSGGRITRHLPMEWIAGAPHAEAPSWELAKVDLKKPEIFDTGDKIDPLVVHQH